MKRTTELRSENQIYIYSSAIKFGGEWRPRKLVSQSECATRPCVWCTHYIQSVPVLVS